MATQQTKTKNSFKDDVKEFTPEPPTPTLDKECRFYELDFKNPDYNSVYEKRLKRLQYIEENPAAIMAHIATYKKYPVRFINDWGVTYDPRKTNPIIPFILFPKQAEYINWLKDRFDGKEDGLVEKSRDMGLTWLNVAFAVWMFLFQKGSKVGFGSRKEALVDKIGDPDCIFEKIRMFINFLPGFLKPECEVPFMKAINSSNGASITGEAGDNIGRGGRSSIYFKDESAFYERPLKIDAALSQNSDVKIDVSTPNGIGNPFYNKRIGGKIAVFTFNWRDDPRKDDAWYKKQVDTLDPIIVAQEIDIDYKASIEGIIFPAEYVRAAVKYNPGEAGLGPKRAGLDVADEGGDENCYVPIEGIVVGRPEAWKKGDTAFTTDKAYNLAYLQDVEIVNYDSIGVGAGVKASYRKLKENPKIKGDIKFIPVNVGVTKLKGLYEDGPKKNKDMFLNLKAQIHWEFRRRLEKTYEVVELGKDHPVEELVSLPNDPELIAEMSILTFTVAENGKIRVESKQSLKSRGVKSPNRLEATLLAFHSGSTVFNFRVL